MLGQICDFLTINTPLYSLVIIQWTRIINLLYALRFIEIKVLITIFYDMNFYSDTQTKNKLCKLKKNAK